MRKLKILIGALFIFISLSAFNYSNSSKNKEVGTSQGYYRASCTKTWSKKFYFTKGNDSSKKEAYQKARKAAANHEDETGHDSGVLGPY